MSGELFDLFHIDDDEADRFLLARAVHLSDLPIELRSASSGEEALRILKSSRLLPDLILLDIRMPMMSGFEVLANCRMRNIPVAMFSSSSEPVDVNRAQELGAQSYYVKPVGLDKLAVFVRTLYERWARSEIPCDWPKTGAAPRRKNT